MTYWIQIEARSKSTSDSLDWEPHNRHSPPLTIAEQGDLEEDDFFDDEDVEEDEDRGIARPTTNQISMTTMTRRMTRMTTMTRIA